MKLIIHPRVCEKHPQLCAADIEHAWRNTFYMGIRSSSRNFPEYLWLGIDAQGRDIEMVGTLIEEGILIFHANTPLSKRTKREVGISSKGH